MPRTTFRYRRPLRSILYILAFLYIAGTVIGGIGLGRIAVHPPSHRITESEEHNAASVAAQSEADFRDASLTAADGTVLQGWFMRPQDWNGNAVILLHGVSDNRMGMYGYGRWLVEHRYAVLLPDARGHGNSDGLASYGVKEADDIRGWVEWIESTIHPHCVYGLGESMGAAELLQALPKVTQFCAVIAESSFATFREVAYARFGRPFHAGPWIGRSIFRPTVDVGFLYVRLHYGLNMEMASPQRAVAASNVPVLLIHGLRDINIPPYHSNLIQASNPKAVVVWKVPGAVHTQAHAAAPEEFDRKVLEWFATHGSSEQIVGKRQQTEPYEH